jgi:hypothetical protein
MLKYRLKKKLFEKTWAVERRTLKLQYLKKFFSEATLEKKYEELVPAEKAKILDCELVLGQHYDIHLNRIMEQPRDLSYDYEIAFISLGYIFFFSGAYPLTVVLLVMITLMKILADMIDFSYCSRRPNMQPSKSWNIWNQIMFVMTFASPFVNCAFAYFCLKGPLNDLIGDYPTYFETDRMHLLVIIAAEHILMILAQIIRFLIPKIPDQVMMQQQKAGYRSLLAEDRMKTRMVNQKEELGKNRDKIKQ